MEVVSSFQDLSKLPEIYQQDSGMQLDAFAIVDLDNLLIYTNNTNDIDAV